MKTKMVHLKHMPWISNRLNEYYGIQRKEGKKFWNLCHEDNRTEITRWHAKDHERRIIVLNIGSATQTQMTVRMREHADEIKKKVNAC